MISKRTKKEGSYAKIMRRYKDIKVAGPADRAGGFTIVELVVVMVIIAIAAMIAIPMISSAGSVQIRAAANMIASDLEYAKSMAISRQQNYSVAFDTTNDSYEMRDAGGAVIGHPVKKGFDYVMDFRNDSRLDKVDIDTASFGSTSEVIFDYLGSPYDGDSNPLNSGVVTLQASGVVMTVSVEPITGYISISD